MRGKQKTKSETPAQQDNLKRKRNQSERKNIRFEGPSKQPVTNLGGLPVSEVIKIDLKISIIDITTPDWFEWQEWYNQIYIKKEDERCTQKLQYL